MKRSTHIPQLAIGLLIVISFILAVSLSTRQSNAKIQGKSNSITAQLLGDSRRLFANHFYIKADEYFHKGYYPSIFDQAAIADKDAKPAMTVGAVGGNAHEGEVEWMEQPRDWIDRFSRHFFPSEHVHLDDGNFGHDHDGDGHQDHAPDEHDDSHDHDHDGDGIQDHSHEEHNDPVHGQTKNAGSDVSEILPWLGIAAELNPDRPEIYVTGAYYLRDRLNQVDEAEAFLREGWRNNPKSPAIIYELARIKEENRDQLDLARNLYRVAIRYWDETESTKEAPDNFLLMQILMRFAKAEQKAGNTSDAIAALKHLQTISPNPESIGRLIEEFESGLQESP